jgi:hypothetical protein
MIQSDDAKRHINALASISATRYCEKDPLEEFSTESEAEANHLFSQRALS